MRTVDTAIGRGAALGCACRSARYHRLHRHWRPANRRCDPALARRGTAKGGLRVRFKAFSHRYLLGFCEERGFGSCCLSAALIRPEEGVLRASLLANPIATLNRRLENAQYVGAATTRAGPAKFSGSSHSRFTPHTGAGTVCRGAPHAARPLFGRHGGRLGDACTNGLRSASRSGRAGITQVSSIPVVDLLRPCHRDRDRCHLQRCRPLEVSARLIASSRQGESVHC